MITGRPSSKSKANHYFNMLMNRLDYLIETNKHKISKDCILYNYDEKNFIKGKIYAYEYVKEILTQILIDYNKENKNESRNQGQSIN